MARDPNPLARWLGPPAKFLAILGGWWLLLLSFITCFEVLGRKLLGFSLQGVDEVGAYTTAIVSSLAFAWALVGKSHTRVDFLLGKLPAPLRALLNALAYALLAAVAVFATLRGWDVLDESLLFDAHSVTPLQTPLWIPQSLWLAGLAAFALVAVAYALHAAWLLLADRDRLNRLYGPITLDEEVELEAGAVMARTAGKDALP
ncbi:TRAP transporter small permease subunit [Falsiroseomonas oryzae]|uniref:TRAP transporter small permease subunit n=1 Tax=Falsiroseomonas oryzae TaxID=2766473 RepID=UPI0022EA7CF5|nr:TRAP transporter small permease [Roseomonas sp. MO-31]